MATARAVTRLRRHRPCCPARALGPVGAASHAALLTSAEIRAPFHAALVRPPSTRGIVHCAAARLGFVLGLRAAHAAHAAQAGGQGQLGGNCLPTAASQPAVAPRPGRPVARVRQRCSQRLDDEDDDFMVPVGAMWPSGVFHGSDACAESRQRSSSPCGALGPGGSWRMRPSTTGSTVSGGRPATAPWLWAVRDAGA